MESKKVTRKLNSLFWSVIYTLPLLFLIISLIGVYTIYSQSATMPNLNYISILDYCINDTINTFNGFIWNDMYNTFVDLFNVIDIDVTSNISNLIIIIFTWFTQAMFMHVFVDVFTFIPKIYHKLMERWL